MNEQVKRWYRNGLTLNTIASKIIPFICKEYCPEYKNRLGSARVDSIDGRIHISCQLVIQSPLTPLPSETN